MSMVINTNTASLVAQAAQAATNKAMDTAMERLSTGKQINTAADDAAGLAIATRMESQIKGLQMAMKNAADGQSLIDTTEGAHDEITNILQRMRELAVQSANDTNVSADRTSLNAEIAQLTAEIDRIATQTTWNGMSVLDGTFTSKQFQIGADAGQNISVSVDSVKAGAIGNYTLDGDSHVIAAANSIDGEDLSISGYLGSATIAVAVGASAKDVAATVNANTGSTGVSATAVTKAKLSSLSVAEGVAFTLTGTASAAISVTVASTSHLGEIKDAINAKSGTTGITAAFGDDTSEIVLTHLGGEDISLTNLTTTTNTTTITVEALDKNGADLSTADTDTLTGDGTDDSVVVGQLSLASIKSFTVSGDDATGEDGFFGTLNGTTTGGTASLSAISGVDISTVSGANNAIRAIDGALNKINAARGDLGAVSNRLDNTINNLTNIKVNIESSQSRIQDADFAAETSNLTKAQILSQAATAMLAQANASKQSVLSLLQG